MAALLRAYPPLLHFCSNALRAVMLTRVVALGKLGGAARAKSTSPADRKKWARLGGLTRAKRHSKAELSKWAKLGGRPKKGKGNAD